MLEPSIESEPTMLEIMASLNRLVHEPARLAILTVLSACRRADFVFLQSATGLSKGNLSVQLTRLQEAELITVTRTIERKRTLTMVELTPAGATELKSYWTQMDRIKAHQLQAAQTSKPAPAFGGRSLPQQA